MFLHILNICYGKWIKGKQQHSRTLDWLGKIPRWFCLIKETFWQLLTDIWKSFTCNWRVFERCGPYLYSTVGVHGICIYGTLKSCEDLTGLFRKAKTTDSPGVYRGGRCWARSTVTCGTDRCIIILIWWSNHPISAWWPQTTQRTLADGDNWTSDPTSWSLWCTAQALWYLTANWIQLGKSPSKWGNHGTSQSGIAHTCIMHPYSQKSWNTLLSPYKRGRIFYEHLFWPFLITPIWAPGRGLSRALPLHLLDTK